MNIFTQMQTLERELSLNLKDPLWLERNMAMIRELQQAIKPPVSNATEGEPQEPLGKSACWAAAAKAYLLAKRDVEDAKTREAGAKKALQDLCEAAGLSECHGGGVQVVKSTHSPMVNYRALAESLLSREIIKEKSEEFMRVPSTHWRISEFRDVFC